MSDDDDEFLRSIPSFLRRRDGRLPKGKPAQSPAACEPAAVAAGPAAPRAASGLPGPAQTPVAREPRAAAGAAAGSGHPARPAAPPQPPQPSVVDLAARQAEAAKANDFPAEQRARIELAFANGTPADDTVSREDVAFQLTLPRSVVRQIRVLAAEKGTTQRAIVLRALRLAGLGVPEGCDVERRGPSAKRSQQA